MKLSSIINEQLEKQTKLYREIKSLNNIGIQHLCIAYNTNDDKKFSEEDVNEYLKSASIILGRKLI